MQDQDGLNALDTESAAFVEILERLHAFSYPEAQRILDNLQTALRPYSEEERRRSNHDR